MPCGNSKNVPKTLACSLAHSAISTKSSQPANTPQNPSMMTSTNGCLRLAHWRRGSAIVCSRSISAHVFVAIPPPSLSQQPMRPLYPNPLFLQGSMRVPRGATTSPLELTRSAISQVTAVLENPTYKGEVHQQMRITQVWKIIEPYFDLDELAKRTLGVHWNERTDEERREFVRLFTALIEKIYSSTLTRYTSDVQISVDQQRIDGNFAEVDTQLINPALGKTIPIQYRLHQVEGTWRIYDVVIENVSMVQNYRTQFNRIITQSSYADLVRSIKEKIS